MLPEIEQASYKDSINYKDEKQLALFSASSARQEKEDRYAETHEGFLKSIKERNFIKLLPSVSIIFVFTMLLMSIYEIVKQLMNPHISIWESHLITIGFASIIAPIGGYIALRKIEKLRVQAVVELEERIRIQEELSELNSRLEEMVDKRTSELSHANESLKIEIDERSKIDIALRESERRYRYLFMESPVGIFYFDKNYRIVEASERLLEMFEISINDIIGFNESYAMDKSLIPAMNLALTGKEGFFDGLYEIAGIGRHKYISMRTTPFYDENKQIAGGMAIIEDITEQKNSEKELIQAKDKAEQSDRLKSEFLAMVSHEIRTPLNVLLSYSNLIKDEVKDTVEDELKDSFGIMKNAGERIIRTVDSMIDMSELNSGNYEIASEEFCVDKLINECILPEFVGIASEKGIDLKFDRLTNNTNVIADRYSLIQIFKHLVDNAVKFTFDGRVEIILKCNGIYTTIVEIKDTGLGMSEEFLPHMFEPFRQEEQGYTRKFEGNGLGLSLVKRYCDLNNIHLEVESKKNEGTSFRIIFPGKNRFFGVSLLN